jgi:hypothetical protein
MLFCSCKSSIDSPETVIQELSADELLSYKRGFVLGTETAEHLYDKEQTADKMIAFAEYAALHQKSKPSGTKISFAEASEDLETYFGFLKDCYAGYLYFGGERRFSEAKSNILNKVPPGGITAGNLEQIIQQEMRFVEDLHFAIGKKKLDTEKWAVAANMYFRKDEDGFYNIDNNKKAVFTGGVSEDHFKPSLCPENSICWQLYVSLDEDIPQRISYGDGSYDNLNWTKISFDLPQKKKAEFREINGIPYLKFDQCYFKTGDAVSVSILIYGAGRLSDSRLAILDLRGNGGGDGILPGRWFKAYSGHKAAYSCDGAVIMNRDLFSQSQNGQTFDDMIKYMCLEPLDENHYAFRGSSEIFNKEGLLIVLVDGYVASAGEHMVDLLHHLSNTLFVGMPTYGAFRGSAVTQYNMEHSGIPVSFGNIIMSFDPSYFKEYTGFMPDIWMPSTDIDRIADLLNSLDKDSR